jgi:hypothetical protein
VIGKGCDYYFFGKQGKEVNFLMGNLINAKNKTCFQGCRKEGWLPGKSVLNAIVKVINAQILLFYISFTGEGGFRPNQQILHTKAYSLIQV